MPDWTDEIDLLVRKLGKTAKGAARAVRSALDDDPFEILAYRGYGDGARAWMHGRVVERRGVGASSETDHVFRNLLNTWRRAASDPLPHARVTVEYGKGSAPMTADDEGYFGGWIDRGEPVTDGDEWDKYSVELESPAQAGDPVKGSGEILVPPSTTRFAVISDIDDTVIQSRVSNFLQAARTVMLGNARTRLPFPGVAAFYTALHGGATGEEKNPVFYVSSSPWNIHDVIAEFMDLQKVPKGPLLLRDWDINLGALSSSRHFDHKGVAIRNILQLYPRLGVILVGDTSQHDPEIYRQIVAEFPSRVKAIYIRDVTRTAERKASVQKLAEEVLAAHSSLVLSDDTLAAAKHATEQGWINPDALAEIGEEKKSDEGKDDSKVATPGGGKPGSARPPTVVEASG